jgi:hypothetical protein
MSSSRLGKLSTSSRHSESEVFNEGLLIEVCPIIALNLLVEGLELLLDLILSCRDHELVLRVAHVGGVEDEQDLGLDSPITSRVFDFKHSVSIA